MVAKYQSLLRDTILREGVTILSEVTGKGSHKKLLCAYKGVEFPITAAISKRPEPRKLLNVRADIRRIKRGIDGNQAVPSVVARRG